MLPLRYANVVMALCAGCNLHLGAQETLRVNLSPGISAYCVAPKEYQFPFSKQGRNARIEAGRYLYRPNSDGYVNIRTDEVVGLWCDTRDDLSFLTVVPVDKLRALTIQGTRIPDAGIPQLKRCSELTHLVVVCDDLDNASAVVGAAPRLEFLGLVCPYLLSEDSVKEDAWPNDRLVGELLKLRRLRGVGISGPRLTDNALRAVAQLPKLEAFESKRATRITNEGLRELAKSKSLREIVLGVGPDVDDEGIGFLLEMEGVNWVEIRGADVRRSTILKLVSRFPDAHIDIESK